MSSNPPNSHRNFDENEVALPGRPAGGGAPAPRAAGPGTAQPARQGGGPQPPGHNPNVQQRPNTGAPMGGGHQPQQHQPPQAPQQHFNTTPRMNPAEVNIPNTDNPVQMDVLLGQLNLSMTIGEGDTIEGTIAIGEGKSMVIKGTVRGKVVCPGVLIITKSGIVEGSIEAAQVWIEGEVTNAGGQESEIDAGVLHIGTGSRVSANCLYDQLSISTPNRGVSGRMISRDSLNTRRG